MKFLWTSFAATWAFVVALMVVPYGNPLIEYGFWGVPFLALTVACTLHIARKGLFRKVLIGFTALGCIAAYVLVTTVLFRDQIVRARLSGTVATVTRSSNHNYPFVEVRNNDGSVAQLEGVSETFFQTVKVNDHVEKAAKSRFASVGDAPVNVLDDSLLDAIRR